MTRNEECIAKLQKIRTMLEENELDGVIIKKQSNFSWVTAGGRGFIGLASENACGMLLVTRDECYLAANNIELPRLLGEELPEVIKPYQVDWWHDGEITGRLQKEFGMLSDDIVLDQWFKTERTHLLPEEAARYKELGMAAAESFEKSCENIVPGMSEQEIAGAISAGLWGLGIEPITMLVAADDRSCHYRHYVPTGKRAEKGFIASICARKGGLIVSATRSVGFVPDFAKDYKKLLEVETAAFKGTKEGRTLGEVFGDLQKAYAQIGVENEWKNHHQGGMTGYMAREYRADSTTKTKVQAMQAYAWNPSMVGAKCEDTVLTTPTGEIEILTPCSSSWPTVELNGWKRPDILYRL